MLLDNNRRKLSNFLIAPKFQFRYIAYLIGSSIVPMLLCGGVITYFLRHNYLLLVNYAALDPDITSLLMWELQFLVGVICVSFLCFFAAITIFGIVFSHRIAGMVYKTRKVCREITSGKDIELKFREKDEFQGLAKDFNAMLRSLRKQQKKAS